MHVRAHIPHQVAMRSNVIPKVKEILCSCAQGGINRMPHGFVGHMSLPALASLRLLIVQEGIYFPVQDV
jgi:hypothetical protein